MRHLALPGFALLLTSTALGVACGGSSSSSNGDTSPDGGGSAAEASTGDDGGAAASEGGGSSSGDAAGATEPTTPIATSAQFGTYIVLGDSISAGGGIGPFFYDLLHQNDDTTYPAWKGHDLATKYPGIQYVHAAIAGSITGAYGDSLTAGAPLLSTQITGLGSSYPGDILITITIGGNDLNDHAGDAILGLDGPQKTTFTSNLKADLDALTKPGRLGTGKVYIVEANIYDATDGQGNWEKGGASCPPYNVSGTSDVSVFGDWNAIVGSAVAAHAGDYLLDIHTLFNGHGFNSTSNWFYTDCIHPNATGHDELRKETWKVLTGEVIND